MFVNSREDRNSESTTGSAHLRDRLLLALAAPSALEAAADTGKASSLTLLEGSIQTVTGLISPQQTGFTLPVEHLLSDPTINWIPPADALTFRSSSLSTT